MGVPWYQYNHIDARATDDATAPNKYLLKHALTLTIHHLSRAHSPQQNALSQQHKGCRSKNAVLRLRGISSHKKRISVTTTVLLF